jgi:hypothetical protein
MSKLSINIGISPNDGKGDPLRVAFEKINRNFNELYLVTSAGSNLYLTENTIQATNTGGDIILAAMPGGQVIVHSALTATGTVTCADAVASNDAMTFGQATGMFLTPADITTPVAPAIIGGFGNNQLALDLGSASAFMINLTSLSVAVLDVLITNIPTTNQFFEITVAVHIEAGITRTLNWPANVRFAGNIQPTVTSNSLIKLTTLDSGANFYAYVVGQGFNV